MALLNLTTVVIAVAAWLLYNVAQVIYRLYFHPLKGIPGPRLAAATSWTETYYECFKPPGGQFMFEYMRWHEKYGPIVRIGPNEVHISDSKFYDQLYMRSGQLRKLESLEHRFANPTSAFATAGHDHHRVRRAALNPFFSTSRISKYSPNVQRHMNKLCNRVAEEYAGTGKVITLNNMWGSFTSDIVIGYACEKSYDFIYRPNFRAEFSNTLQDMLDPVHFFTQFPWTLKTMQKLPDWLVVRINPQMESIVYFTNQMGEQIERARDAQMSGAGKPEFPSIFTTLIGSDLPPEEQTTLRLQHECMAIVAAGLETTMFTSTVASYHLLANPKILGKLLKELKAAIPDVLDMPHLDTLMQLPYLTCVIYEALRMSFGVSQRMPRTSPTPIIHTAKSGVETVFPIGTIISMDNVSVSWDPEIFPQPLEFRPERWENNALAPDGRKLTAYLVAFSKGPRSCGGMSLAYAMLYIGLATFFSRFEVELYETNRDAVDFYKDNFVPRPKPGTKGVRVKILRDLARA